LSYQFRNHVKISLQTNNSNLVKKKVIASLVTYYNISMSTRDTSTPTCLNDNICYLWLRSVVLIIHDFISTGVIFTPENCAWDLQTKYAPKWK